MARQVRKSRSARHACLPWFSLIRNAMTTQSADTRTVFRASLLSAMYCCMYLITARSLVRAGVCLVISCSGTIPNAPMDLRFRPISFDASTRRKLGDSFRSTRMHGLYPHLQQSTEGLKTRQRLEYYGSPYHALRLSSHLTRKSQGFECGAFVHKSDM